MVTTSKATVESIKHITQDQLYISEPSPFMFGNRDNEASNSAWTNGNWLKSRFHFSFAEWRSGPHNFGPLRVLNDDLVQPKRGFGAHPHHDMEIMTYVVNGEITHKDSMGTEETLGPYSIQFMSAATGVRHSEYNHSDTTPLRFLQIWIMPRASSTKPNYGSYDAKGQPPTPNQFTVLVSDVQDPVPSVPVHLNQDIKFSVAVIDEGKSATFTPSAPNRMLYVVQVEGSSIISASPTGSTEQKIHLQQHEALKITKSDFNLVFSTENGKSHVAVLDLPAS